MAVELIPSSFRCDCGHESHFFERTIREMKKISKKSKQSLGDNDDHLIIFHKEEVIEIICPTLGTCKITGFE